MENSFLQNHKAKWWLVFGSTLITLSIILGAFGAHALKQPLGESLDSYKTAVSYLQLGGFSIFMGVLLQRFFQISVGKFLAVNTAGTLLFSLSIFLVLYLKIGAQMSVPTLLALVTPLGGTVLISSWVLLIIEILRIKSKS